MLIHDLTIIDNENVAERTASLAAEHGELAAQEITRVLKRHIDSGVVSKGIAETVAEDEAIAASAEFIVERMAGNNNDKQNTVSRGVTALLFETGKNQIDQDLPESRRTSSGPFFEEVGELPRDFDNGIQYPVYKLALPKGIFYAQHPNHRKDYIVFNTQGELYNDGTIFSIGQPFQAHDSDVIRLVGAGGELWQNPAYNLDGSLSIQQPAVGAIS